jgi:hypothetical protein
MKKIIAIIFMLCAISILATSGFLYLNAQDEISYFDFEMEYDAMDYKISRFDYASKLKDLFPTSDEHLPPPTSDEPLHIPLEGDGEYQGISNYMGLKRDNFLNEVRSLEKNLEDEAEAYKNFSRTKEWQVWALEEIIAYILLPLSFLLFLISIYFLVISFKNPTKIIN